MRTSATGISTNRLPRRYDRGFSLLELLIVVAVIGILAGAVILSMGVTGRDRVLEREALRLQSLLSLLREEAVMQSRDYGLLFNSTGYQFFLYDRQNAQWLPPGSDKLLEPHTLPKALRLELVLEDQDLALAVDSDSQTEDAPEPQVMLLASGELTPFEADFSRPPRDGRYIVKGTLTGKLEVSQDGFD